MSGAPQPRAATEFSVWGCRGSRNLVPSRSAIGNNTSCYSARSGSELFVFDAGRGLAALGYALWERPSLRQVRRVSVLVSHAHMDHWEGLKDVDWFWRRDNGLEVEILGPQEALQAIRSGFGHPSYVALDLLADGTVAALRYQALDSRESRSLGGWGLTTGPLNHYSGPDTDRQVLSAIGFGLTAPDGARIAYLCDHEPTRETAEVERELLRGAHLAVYDAHFPDIKDHAHGHGSQEHAARMAREFPRVLVLAGHHGPLRSDEEIQTAFARHGRGLANFQLAVEGATHVFGGAEAGFGRSESRP
jgi:phosphoribosyl 1,2-cyclic phosphodiesterase